MVSCYPGALTEKLYPACSTMPRMIFSNKGPEVLRTRYTPRVLPKMTQGRSMKLTQRDSSVIRPGVMLKGTL